MMIKEMACSFCGETASCTVDGKPYCNKHYQKMKMYGTPEGRARKWRFCKSFRASRK